MPNQHSSNCLSYNSNQKYCYNQTCFNITINIDQIICKIINMMQAELGNWPFYVWKWGHVIYNMWKHIQILFKVYKPIYLHDYMVCSILLFFLSLLSKQNGPITQFCIANHCNIHYIHWIHNIFIIEYCKECNWKKQNK